MARAGVTQVQLAKRIGMKVPALRRRLTEETPLLVADLLAIASELDVMPGTLVDPAMSPKKTTASGASRRRSRTPKPSAQEGNE